MAAYIMPIGSIVMNKVTYSAPTSNESGVTWAAPPLRVVNS